MNPSVSLFVPCLVDSHYPRVGMAVVRVLERLGLGVACPPDQTCCGQPAFNAGYRKEARAAARRFVEVFQDAETVVCPSGSCVAMVRLHYPLLFADHPDWLRRARAVAARTFEFTEFLVDVLGAADLGARFDGRVTYHDSCHLLRSLGIRGQPRRLLAGVAGADFVEMERSDACCGFGGTFAVKYPEISAALADEKAAHIRDTGAEAVVGCDMGCLMNIQGRLSRIGSDVKVLHMAELLAGVTP